MAKKPKKGAKKPRSQTKRLIGGLDAGNPLGKPPKTKKPPAKSQKAPAPKVEKDTAKPAEEVAKKAGMAPAAAAASKPDPKAIEKELLPDQMDWQALYAKRVEIRALEVKESAAKAAHASAKKALDNANVELGQLLDDIVNPEKHTGVLPFPNTPAAKLSFAADKTDQVPDAWRAEKIEALKLSTSLEEALKAKGVHTLGDLSDAMQKGEAWYRDFKGIGVGKAETIGDALQKYWADHKVGKEPKVQTDPATPAAPTGAPDSTPIAQLKIEQRLKDALTNPAVITLQGGHKRQKPAWTTVGDIRARKLGQRSGGEEGEGEINAGRLASIPGISPADESAIEEAISKWVKTDPASVVSDILRQADEAQTDEDKAWKTKTIASLKWSQGLRKKLKDAGITTLGALATVLGGGVAIVGISESEMGDVYGLWKQAVDEIRGQTTAPAASEGGKPTEQKFEPGEYAITFPGTSKPMRHYLADCQSDLEEFVRHVLGIAFESAVWDDKGLNFVIPAPGGGDCDVEIVAVAALESPTETGESDDESE